MIEDISDCFKPESTSQPSKSMKRNCVRPNVRDKLRLFFKKVLNTSEQSLNNCVKPYEILSLITV